METCTLLRVVRHCALRLQLHARIVHDACVGFPWYASDCHVMFAFVDLCPWRSRANKPPARRLPVRISRSCWAAVRAWQKACYECCTAAVMQLPVSLSASIRSQRLPAELLLQAKIANRDGVAKIKGTYLGTRTVGVGPRHSNV